MKLYSVYALSEPWGWEAEMHRLPYASAISHARARAGWYPVVVLPDGATHHDARDMYRRVTEARSSS